MKHLIPVVLVWLAAAPVASANTTQESIFRDDAVLGGDAAKRDRSLDEIAGLGVDTIHSIVSWRRIAPAAGDTHRPSFDASDPADYDPAAWDYLDAIVRGADARGLGVILAPAGSAPLWASGCDSHDTTDRPGVCKPSVREYQRFVIALAKRYSGTYKDENGGVLPRVSRWSVWNEPNQGGWLQPQWEHKRGEWAPTAAYRYRRMFEAAARGLRKNGHAHDQIMIGETAPLGRSGGSWYKRSMSPVTFWRAVLCIDKQGHALRGDAARNLGCHGYRELDADAVSDHPYTRGAGGDPRSHVGRDDINISYHRRLRTVLDQGAHAHRNRRYIPFYITEYGFQTDPPDKQAGVRPSLAAKWLNESDFIAYSNGRIRGVAQYELVDEQAVGSFQTGLRYFNGDPKPSYDAYRVPIWVVKHSTYYRVWGQARPAQPGQHVEVQYQNSRRGGWKRLRSARMGPSNYIDIRTRRRSRKWRLVWTAPNGGTYTSREAFPESR